jgi:hypothetical protein
MFDGITHVSNSCEDHQIRLKVLNLSRRLTASGTADWTDDGVPAAPGAAPGRRRSWFCGWPHLGGEIAPA